QELLRRSIRPRGRRGVSARACPREIRPAAARGAARDRRRADAVEARTVRRRAGEARSAIRPALAALPFLAAVASHSTAPQTKTSAEVLLNERMAAVLLRQEQPVDAERAYRDVIKDDPNNPDLYDGLGSALLMQGRFHEALDQFDHAVKL